MNFIGYFLLFSLYCPAQLVQGNNASQGDEYDLKTYLFQRYMKSVRPVKVYTTPVNVTFDLALRAVVDLDEKNQILTTSTWIRVYWTDQNLMWDPEKYNGISSINLAKDQLWVPDLVLYNSADSTGRGLLDYAMRTNVMVNHNGSCSWLCPMILKSECTVDIQYFPFDQQSCPLQFGLWTYTLNEVDFTLRRNSMQADVSNYLESGEWILESTPAVRVAEKFPCCPYPFSYIIYKINIIRKTKFFLLNLIWPGILIALLASLSYLLPPECGERIGLSITNLLAMMVFLLLISENIPPTSDAIPLASKFYSCILILSALTLLSSALTISLTISKPGEKKKIPWFIRIVVNQWLARVLFVDTSVTTCNPRKKHKDPQSYNLDNCVVVNRNSYRNGDACRPKENGTMGDSYNGHVRNDESTGATKRLEEDVDRVVTHLDNTLSDEEYHMQWRKAAKVLDRFFLSCFMVCVFSFCLYFYDTAPRFYVS